MLLPSFRLHFQSLIIFKIKGEFVFKGGGLEAFENPRHGCVNSKTSGNLGDMSYTWVILII